MQLNTKNKITNIYSTMQILTNPAGDHCRPVTSPGTLTKPIGSY